MANKEVWTVRGVGEGYRKMAKAGAAEWGIGIGEWVERAIKAAKQPGKKSRRIGEVVDSEEVESMKMPEIPAEAGGLNPGDTVNELIESAHEKPVGRNSRSVCVHGMEKGYNCWQCGGKAVVK